MKDEHTESSGCQQWEDDTVAWPVALEDLAFDQRLAGIWSQLFPNLLLGLTEGQSLGLGEEVGEKDTVVERITDRVKGGCGGDKISRDQLSPLMNELVERVLAVSSSGAPDDRLKYHKSVIAREFLATEAYTSLVIHTLTSLGNELSVRLHISLLEVIGELVEILIVGEKKLSLGAVEIVVPDANDGQNDGKVLLKGCFLEVLVHAVSTLEELLEVIIADNESDR